MTALCPICRATDDLFPLLSVLDFTVRHVCGRCVDHRAEPADVVSDADDVDPEIFRSVRVYHQGQYLTIQAWAKLQQQAELAATVTPVIDEEDRKLAAIMASVVKMSGSMQPRTRR